MNSQFIIDMQIAIAALYTIYPLLISGKVAHKYARLYLLSITPLSAIIALVKIPFWTPSPPMTSLLNTVQEANITNITPTAIEQTTSYLPYIYWGGVAIMGLWFTIALIKVLLLMASIKPQNGIRYIENGCAFSFFNALFISTKYKGGDLNAIITHEKCHASYLHSIDVIYCNICRTLLWFNPFSWFIFHSLRQVHEWQADASVIGFGVDKIKYIDLLLEAGSTTNVQVVNSINYSLTKKRITMIAKNQNRSALRLVAALPVLLVLVFCLSLTTKASPTKSTMPAHTSTEETPVETPVVTAELMPIFIEGSTNSIEDFRSWVGKNLSYPEQAQKDKVQGRVFVNFVVETDGTVSNVALLRGVSAELDQAAIDAVTRSPKWYKAGHHKGKAVRFTFTMPIEFKL